MRAGVAVDQTDDGTGQEGTEDGLQAELFGQCHEGNQQHHGRPDPDLGRGVLQPDQRRSDPPRAPCGRDHEPRNGDEEGEQGNHHQSFAGTTAFGREQQGKHQYCGEVGDRGGRDGRLPDLSVDLTGILQYGNHQAE